MKLTSIKIKHAIQEAKSQGKKLRLFDGKGLYLEITPQGGTRWRFKYRFDGKEKLLSLGLFPEISLKDARERLLEMRSMVAKGINPSDLRKAEKEAQNATNTLKSVALEWWQRNKHKWSEGHGYQVKRRLELNIFPWLGTKSISEITPAELLNVLRRIEERNAIEMAHRVKSNVGQVMRYAVATGRAERDITYDLKDALTPVKKRHYPSITDPRKISGLLRAIDSYEGSYVTKSALKLAPLTFVRPGELRNAEWCEINFETKEWRIPAEKMKAGKLHIVPLSEQSIAILNEIKPLTGRSQYVFPSTRSTTRPLSNNTINAALRRMGYATDEMTGHGFRSMASTLLNEQGYRWDAIERQLAHAERNDVRASYNYAQYLPERTQMMQEWADYLDQLKSEE